jgi:hypothetical protein
MKIRYAVSRLDDLTHQQISYLPSQSLTREPHISNRMKFSLNLPVSMRLKRIPSVSLHTWC